MKKLYACFVLGLLVILNVQGQEGRPGTPIGGIIVKGGKNPGGNYLLTLGGGITSPDKSNETANFLGKGFNLNTSFYTPVYTFSRGTSHFFTIGPDIFGSFSNLKGSFTTASQFNIAGQSKPPATFQSSKGDASTISIGAGLQANFSFNKITISPALNGGYFSYSQQAFTSTQTSEVNGKSYNFELYKKKEIKERGFAWVPKIRIGFYPGKLGFFAESNYTFGPAVNSEQSRLKPLGESREGNYQLDQLLSGQQVEMARHTPFKNLEFNFGLSYSIQKRRAKTDLFTNETHSNPSVKQPDPGAESPEEKGGENPLYESQGTPMNPLFEQALMYDDDYQITDATVLSYLNSNQVIIAKGIYKTDFSENPFGDITLKLAVPISAKGINQAGVKRIVAQPEGKKGIQENGIKKADDAPGNEKGIQENGIKRADEVPVSEKGIQENGIRKTDEAGNENKSFAGRPIRTPPTERIAGNSTMPVKTFIGYRCNAACNEEGTQCFTGKVGAASALFYEFEILPVIEGNVITSITLSNISISQNGTAFPSDWLSKKGYDSWKASSDMVSAKTVNPLYQGSGNSGTNPLAQKTAANQGSETSGRVIVNTTKSNTKDRMATVNSANIKMMQIVYSGADKSLKNFKLSVLGTGETSANGIPIVSGKVITGTISGKNAAAQASYTGTGIVIRQVESGDEGSDLIDHDGHFTIELQKDTAHTVYINNIEFGKIKIESQRKDNARKPGNPIGGIIVKGGKSPGGQLRLITNSNGEFTFHTSEAADFSFTLEEPDTNTLNSSAARPGGPIGGIIVKGGKNPGGQLFTLKTNEQGVIVLKNIPPGNYKFRVTVPTQNENPEYQ